LFDGKVNLINAFGRSKFKVPNSFEKHFEKLNFYTKSVFDKMELLFMVQFSKHFDLFSTVYGQFQFPIFLVFFLWILITFYLFFKKAWKFNSWLLISGYNSSSKILKINMHDLLFFFIIINISKMCKLFCSCN